MLKWTVKKRFAGEQQLDDDYESVNGVKKTRRSLGNVLGDNQSKNVSKYHRRRSLGSQICNERVKVDKENHLVTPVRRKSNRQTPLGDSSNKRRENCNKRKHHLISSTALTSPTISPISFNFKEVFVEPSAIIFPSSYAPTLPTFDVEYSPVMKSSQNLVKSSIRVNDEVPIKRMKMDLMDLSYEFQPESASTSSPLSTPLVSRKVINEKKVPLNLSNDSESSLNSSEVGDTTLQKMIDDILASARNGKKFKSGLAESKKTGRDTNANFMKNLSEICENMEEKSIVKLLSPEKITEAADKTIIIANTETQNEREVKSPMVKKDVEIVDFRADETCQLKRQNAVRRKNTSNENKNKKKCEESQGKSQKEFQDSSIQKCLSFSSANFDDVSDKFKRSSVASYSSGSSNSYVSQSKYTKSLLTKGSIEMTISTEENQKKIVIHVLKCKHLPKTTDIPHVNAYVKCAMVTLNSPSGHHNTYQRTAVHKNSTEPVFDHKFNFDLNNSDDHEKYLQLAVWHRNRSLKRSEFIGCLTVSVKNILEKNIEGTFKLQPQSFLLRPAPLIVETDDSLSKHEETFQRIHEENNDNLLLRYLELSNTKSCGHHEGRTPFTLTRIIKKSPEDAFGFEISWSKPPKINSVKTLSKSLGLEKGDFIIFVGDTNIVAMQKEEIINLIRAQGNILTLEIFRSTGQVSSREIIEKLASKNTPTVELNHSENLKLEKNDLIETPRSHKISHFKQPQVCFQPTIGSGVIV